MNFFATVHLSRIFFLTHIKIVKHSPHKENVSLSDRGWYINEGGLVKGFTINSFAFQKSQNEIIVIIDF